MTVTLTDLEAMARASLPAQPEVYTGAPEAFPAVVIFVLVMGITFPFLGRIRGPARGFLMKVFVVAFLLRVALAVAIQLAGIQFVVASDATFYDWIGQAVARSWRFDAPETFTRFLSPDWSGWGMSYFVGALYYVFGESLLMVQVLASWAGALVAVLVYFIAREVFADEATSRVASALVAVLPALVLWSSQGVKDPFITLGLALALWAVIQSQKQLRAKYVALLAGSLLVIFALRSYVAYILLGAIGVSVFLNLVVRPERAGRAFFGVLLGAAVLLVVLGSRVVEQAEIFTDLSDIAARRQWAAGASASGFARGVDVSTPLGALAFLPVGLVHILFAPFPWQMRNLQQIATLPDMLIWWALVPFLFYGLFRAVKDRFAESSVLIIFSFLLASAYAISVGALGTVYRQRTQFVVFLVVFGAFGVVRWFRRRRDRARMLQERREMARESQRKAAAARRERRRAGRPATS